jgi:hypothetical protein
MIGGIVSKAAPLRYVPDGAIGTEMINDFYPFYAACFCNDFVFNMKS